MKAKKLIPDDFKHLFSQDVEQMEARYAGSFIYKYLYFSDPRVLDEFLSRPTIKFAHKDDLKDPFELSKRWLKFGCPFDKGMFDKYVHKPVGLKLSDVGSVRKKLGLMAKEKIPWLSRSQRRKNITSKIGRREVASVREDILSTASFIETQMPNMFSDLEGEFIEDFARTTGILSLTENPNSLYMWREYAADGHGFVIQFNAVHEFFSHNADDGTVRKLIRPVFYRDDRIDDFWKNPYYLFLVKERCWEFEQEWRVLRPLDRCRKVDRTNGLPLYLVDAPPKLIASVIFAYNVTPALIDIAATRLLNFDSDIKIMIASLGTNSDVAIMGL